jgi:hypothetical protein
MKNADKLQPVRKRPMTAEEYHRLRCRLLALRRRYVKLAYGHDSVRWNYNERIARLKNLEKQMLSVESRLASAEIIEPDAEAFGLEDLWRVLLTFGRRITKKATKRLRHMHQRSVQTGAIDPAHHTV